MKSNKLTDLCNLADNHTSSAKPSHSRDHINCTACELARTEALRTMITAEMRFNEAASIWLNLNNFDTDPGYRSARYIRKNTEISYRQYCESLALFFGSIPIGNIHFGHLREYQKARIGGLPPFIRRRRPHEEPAPSPAAAKKVNQELAVLRRVMRKGNCWGPELEEFYKPLMEEENDALRALEPDEQAHWLATAQKSERWQVVYWYSLLGLGTAMSTNEMRLLRIGDVNLYHQTVTVSAEGAKCRGRRRGIPLLTSEELWAAEKLVERAKACGSVNPQHYVFPFRMKKYHWIPSRPMSTSGIKREWNEVRAASGIPWFRQYDLRHTGGTRMAESGWRPELIKSRMGHLTNKMHEHYMHIGESAQRREMERTSAMRFAPRAERFGPPVGVKSWA